LTIIKLVNIERNILYQKVALRKLVHIRCRKQLWKPFSFIYQRKLKYIKIAGRMFFDNWIKPISSWKLTDILKIQKGFWKHTLKIALAERLMLHK